MIVWKSRVLLRHKHPRPRSRHIPLNRQRAHSSFRQGATRSGVLPNCVRHHPVFGNSRRRAHTQNSRFCGHFSRMIAGIFRSLPRDIASRAEFGASVSGAKNPVPNSIWAASACHEVHGATCMGMQISRALSPNGDVGMPSRRQGLPPNEAAASMMRTRKLQGAVARATVG